MRKMEIWRVFVLTMVLARATACQRYETQVKNGSAGCFYTIWAEFTVCVYFGSLFSLFRYGFHLRAIFS